MVLLFLFLVFLFQWIGPLKVKGQRGYHFKYALILLLNLKFPRFNEDGTCNESEYPVLLRYLNEKLGFILKERVRIDKKGKWS